MFGAAALIMIIMEWTDMFSYSSIPRCNKNGWNKELYTFDKIDGNQLTVQYSPSQGFYKFSTRTQLIDKNTPMFGEAIPIFQNTLAEPLTDIIHKNKWDRVVVFCEFFGEKSFAGKHEKDDSKKIILFDVSLHYLSPKIDRSRNYGLLPPDKFLEHFQHLPIPNFLGIKKWDYDFIQLVKNSKINGMGNEGVVGKVKENGKILMVKYKTDKWLNEVKNRYSPKEAEELINS